MAHELTAEEAFAMVARSTGLSVDMTMGLYTKGLGSVTAFAAIHSDLCVAAPSDVALQAVISLLLHAFPHLTFVVFLS